MSRLPRPHIPLPVRIEVASRQLVERIKRGLCSSSVLAPIAHMPRKRDQLNEFLKLLFGTEKYHLDHDPSLGARKKVYRKGVHVDYSPRANDVLYLIYRTVTEHRLKTNVRGEHGQHPDRVLIKKNRRLERKTLRRKVKIRSANRWPPRGSRKIQNRKRP